MSMRALPSTSFSPLALASRLVPLWALLLVLCAVDNAHARGIRPCRAFGACCSFLSQPRPQDELWILSTRCLPTLGCGQTRDGFELTARRYDAEQGWVESTLEEFLAHNDMTTWMFVHGNRREPNEVIPRLLMVYGAMVVSEPDHPPVRFVAWSWPSDQVRGPIRDARGKAWRTETEAWYLANTLAQFDPETPVSVMGFSFGARIITGSLQLLAGGEISSRTLPADSGPGPAHIRTVLVAAAVHHYWLLPEKYHGMALERSDFTLNIYTSCDEALKHYHGLEKCSDPVALGYVGIARWNGYHPPADRYDQENVACCIGCEHMLPDYLCNSYALGRIFEGMTGHPPVHDQPAEEAPAETAAESLPPAPAEPAGL